MLEPLLKFSVLFFSILTVVSLYLGGFGLIYPTYSFIALIFSLLASVFLLRNELKGILKVKKEELWALKFIAIFLIVCFYISLSSGLYLVFPHGAGDFQNHVRSVRIIAKQHSLYKNSLYPQLYYALASTLYSIYPHTYPVNSFLAIIFLALSSIPVFLLARNYFSAKVASLSIFFYLFSITSLFLLEQGYFTQIMGQFFFISGVYYYLKEKPKFLTLSLVGLTSYPHLYFIFVIFLFISFLFSREKRKVIFNAWVPFLFSLIIISPFFLPELLNYYFASLKHYTHVGANRKMALIGPFVVRGGILTPSFISLLFFLPSLFVFMRYLKKEGLFYLNLCLISIIIFSLFVFLSSLVYYTFIEFDLHTLYLAVKAFYLSTFILSIFSSQFFNKKLSPNILRFFISIYMLYFLGYAFSLPQKASFPNAFFAAAEYLDTLPGEFKVGVDDSLIKNMNWEPNLIYRGIVDIPDNGYSSGGVAKTEAARALQFHWANYRFENGSIVVYDSKNESVISYGKEGNFNYFLTENCGDEKVIFRYGSVFVCEKIS